MQMKTLLVFGLVALLAFSAFAVEDAVESMDEPPADDEGADEDDPAQASLCSRPYIVSATIECSFVDADIDQLSRVVTSSDPNMLLSKERRSLPKWTQTEMAKQTSASWART